MCDICKFVRNTPEDIYAFHNIQYYHSALPDTIYSAVMCGQNGNFAINAVVRDKESHYCHRIQVPITHCPFCGEKLT